jgi:hypothetical protein
MEVHPTLGTQRLLELKTRKCRPEIAEDRSSPSVQDNFELNIQQVIRTSFFQRKLDLHSEEGFQEISQYNTAHSCNLNRCK